MISWIFITFFEIVNDVTPTVPQLKFHDVEKIIVYKVFVYIPAVSSHKRLYTKKKRFNPEKLPFGTDFVVDATFAQVGG